MNKILENIIIIYENNDFIVVDKPAGLIVHEGAGETGPTLVDWFLKKYPEIKKYFSNSERKMSPERVPVEREFNLRASHEANQNRANRLAREAKEKVTFELAIWPDATRPGVVHRLDKDTSGLILLAKNPKTLVFFQDQFRNRTTEKTYLALVLGKVEPKEGIIKGMIGRDQNNRQKQRSTYFSFSWDKGKTKTAETYYNTLKYLEFNNVSVSQRLNQRKSAKSIFTLLEVKPKTGRMHQIRVHLKQEGWPIIGDQVYNTKESKKISHQLGLTRQFLHAHKLKVQLPSHEIKEFKSDLSDDLQSVLNKLK